MKPIEEMTLIERSTSLPSGETLVQRLRTRASIRRNIKDRKSVQEGKPDRISDLLEEAADEIERLNKYWYLEQYLEKLADIGISYDCRPNSGYMEASDGSLEWRDVKDYTVQLVVQTPIPDGTKFKRI